MSAPSPHLYRKQALALDRDPATVSRALELENRIRARGAHPVFTLNHLAGLTGASWKYLRAIVARLRDPYLDIDRPKGAGRTRPISSPEPVLMDVQRWILHNILCACSVHPSSYAYQRERSIVGCAEMHLDARWLIKLDLHSFFHNVFEPSVYPIFRRLGYPRLLSLELTRLCTRRGPVDQVGDEFKRYGDKAPYRVLSKGLLPQGAPTSGALANAVMFDTDTRLDALARSEGLVYTRYSDDLTFSAGQGFSRQSAAQFIRRASAIVERSGFSPHRDKTRVVPPGARHVVLGLLLANDGVLLPPEFKRRLEVHIRGVAKFGIAEHAQWRHFDSVLSMINHVDGCIAFAKSVEPKFAEKMRTSWNTTLEARGYVRIDRPKG